MFKKLLLIRRLDASFSLKGLSTKIQSRLPACTFSGGPKPVARWQSVARSQSVLHDGRRDGIQAEILLKLPNSSIQLQVIIFLKMKIIFTRHSHENDFIKKKERANKINLRRKNVDFATQRESPDDNDGQEQGSDNESSTPSSEFEYVV